ncbi:GHKL domain-containing protein [Candidatus Sumerlaeota bacterium]|nr:GHKL domain-containing protein [Candidatus Sumerlaeota bacterium]
MPHNRTGKPGDAISGWTDSFDSLIFFYGGASLITSAVKYVRSPAGLALLLLLLTLFLFWGGGWYILEVLKDSKEIDLEKRLWGIGETAASVRLNGQTFLLLENPATAEEFLEDLLDEFQSLQNTLKNLKDKNGLRSVLMIDEESRVLIDADNEFSIGEEYPLLALDKEEIRKAFSGASSATLLYKVGDDPFKRCYVPLYNSRNEVTAVLRLEASRDYFNDILRVKKHIYWIGTIVACLLILVAMLFYNLLKSLLKTEETLAMTDRFRSLGTLAAGFAHEIRNPLSIIRATAESLSDELPNEAEQQAFLKSIVDETDRLNHLLTQFLQFASPLPSQDKNARCDVHEMIPSIVSMLQRDFEKKSIEIKMNLESNLPHVSMDDKSLRQILLNLLLNAGEAIMSQGKIEITAMKKKDSIRIEITDTGKGIPDESKTRAFDPFYTTKDKGTGLGLFVTRMLVERANGRIFILDNNKSGAKVTIEIPIS